MSTCRPWERLLRDAFVAKKQMNPDIAEGTPIEAMLEAATTAGAWGGKVCGAGGGGYVLVAAPLERHAAVRDALTTLGGQFAPFSFTSNGVRVRTADAVWTPTR